ncbi:sulfotransferase [uncultured Cocleimonas sp.]|uniref:sulfotransferase family protein n=1 Tax=uncultured Cocleimonas sp. TaxID=1051587 RepID=UPI0026198BE9|nr:sulfotransferase [uncultured Cocleimonas sp.]
MTYKTIIIIGAPRSGTNMLRDILSSIDNVGTWPCDEINYIWRHGNIRSETDEFAATLATPTIKTYIRKQFKKLAQQKDLKYVIEKTCANSLRVGFVDQVIPDAHYIYITRNGLDVIASANLRWTAKLDIPYLLKKVRYVPFFDLPYYATRYFWSRIYRVFSQEKRLAFWGPQLKDLQHLLKKNTLDEICAIQWKQCVEKSEDDFRNIPKERITRVSYENFVDKPETELQTILEEIGIEFDKAHLKEFVSRVSKKSVGKWKQSLNNETLDRINPLIKDTMIKLGYRKENL